jgi:hypothetical protein
MGPAPPRGSGAEVAGFGEEQLVGGAVGVRAGQDGSVLACDGPAAGSCVGAAVF